MSDGKTQQEPSMEEILASIRRIISEDADGQKPASTAEAGAPSPAPEPAEDILELTDRVNDDGSVVNLSGDAEDRPSFTLDGDQDDKEDIAFDQEEFSEALMSGNSSSAAASAFAQLEQEMSVPPRPAAAPSAPLSGGGMTVEELVSEAVRPLLKSWLDANLPAMVEDLVRAEIERVAQAGRRR